MIMIIIVIIINIIVIVIIILMISVSCVRQGSRTKARLLHSMETEWLHIRAFTASLCTALPSLPSP